jgi:hypothetical protein
MYWEAGMKFLILSVYSYVRHFFKHFRLGRPHADSRKEVGAGKTPSSIEDTISSSADETLNKRLAPF